MIIIDGKAKFRGALFGFSKTDVYNFIKSTSESQQKQLSSKEDEITALRIELDEFRNRTSSLSGAASSNK